MSAVFQGLNQEAYDRQYSDRQLFERIYTYFNAYRLRLWGIIGIVSFLAALGVGQPLVVSESVGGLSEQPSTGTIILFVSVMALFGVGYWLINWYWRRQIVRLIGDVVTDMRRDAFNATIQHDMAFFDEYESGLVISRITTDTQEFALVVQLVADIISQFLLVLILITILFSISVPLTLVLLILGPVIGVITTAFRRLARVVTRQGFQVLGKVNASIQEAVTGISIAKNFRQEAAIYQRFSDVNQQAFEVNLRRGVVLSAVFPTLILFSGLGTAAIMYGGGYTAGLGWISVGSWYLFMVSVDRFWFPLINLSSFWSQLQGGLSASERIFSLIDAQPKVHQHAQEQIPPLKGHITFEGVDFRYSEQEQVLNKFSLDIAPGESIALVGHTGAGKSSIVKLITRFYEFQAGHICVDENDIRSLELASYRRQLGIVSQVPFLFTGTVVDNIRYARPELTDDEVETIARQIGEGDWLDNLPDGIHTEVGERGGRLSMGQRQLVALARVLAQEPAIFILDEATASVDPFTEAQIQEALDLILKRSTSILIAHRLSTIRSVNRIVVLEKGHIIEEGGHNALMAQDGHYAELYNTYFRHQSPDYRPS